MKIESHQIPKELFDLIFSIRKTRDIPETLPSNKWHIISSLTIFSIFTAGAIAAHGLKMEIIGLTLLLLGELISLLILLSYPIVAIVISRKKFRFTTFFIGRINIDEENIFQLMKFHANALTSLLTHLERDIERLLKRRETMLYVIGIFSSTLFVSALSNLRYIIPDNLLNQLNFIEKFMITLHLPIFASALLIGMFTGGALSHNEAEKLHRLTFLTRTALARVKLNDEKLKEQPAKKHMFGKKNLKKTI